jgi:dethiobiotin synthetase
VAVLMKKGIRVGYCKPVGQMSSNVNNVVVDKDTVLFSDLMKFKLDPLLHSPVILGKGATTAFLDHPEKYNYQQRIIAAAEQLNEQHDIVIYEGTGHPGVGSIVNLSNADVAKIIDAPVIMVVEGGIGSTIDMLSLCLAKFRLLNVPILGVIVNKVKPRKIDKVKKYLGKYLKSIGLPLLGVLPYDKSLAYPLMKTVAKAVNGIVSFNPEALNNKVEDIIAGSLLDVEELKSAQNLLLIVSSKKVNDALGKIQTLFNSVDNHQTPLSGIVVTGNGLITGIASDYIAKHKIPVIRTSLDTYGSVIKISRIEVKINLNSPWKVTKAIELIEENLDVDALLNQLK